MKFKLISDTHFEWFPADREVLDFIDQVLVDDQSPETVLLHAGDLHCASKLEWVLGELALRFRAVVYVPGNHEAYGSSIESLHDLLVQIRYENLYVLNPGVVHFEDVTVIGATLWTNLDDKSPAIVEAVEARLNDFRRIRGMTSGQFTALHRRDVRFITTQLELAAGRKVILLTHYLPSHQCIDRRFRQYQHSALNYGFAAELDDMILDYQPTYWLFGHTHDSTNTKIGITRLLANPYGYPHHGENPDFIANRTIEL